MISVRFQGKPFNITVLLVCAPNTTAKDAEVHQFYEDLHDLLYLTLKKKKKKGKGKISFSSKRIEMQKEEVKRYPG